MSLSRFILANQEDIIQEFAAFAQTLMPEGVVMSEVELRDHAAELLAATALDMNTEQSSDEQSRKSMGRGTARLMSTSGTLHADARLQRGFSLRSLLAEFRALRAVVLHRYELSGASDLSEVRRFNESIDEAMAESTDRYAARTDSFRDLFLGILGHDLRDPLGAIRAGAALLALPEDDPSLRCEVTSRMLSSADRMQRMIADLLDVAQARLGGSIPIKRSATDLRDICADVIVEAQAAFPSHSVQLEKHGELRGDWDADRLTQLVSNLVNNAIRHGDGTLVTLVARDDGDHVQLTVHNGGPAIPAEMMPFLFEPLARGRGGMGRPSLGIGLGLFIARLVVSAHGGVIEANSSNTLGTVFRVCLPKRAPHR